MSSAPFKPVTFSSASLTASRNSDAIYVGEERTVACAIDVAWTGSPVSSVTITGSVDGTTFSVLDANLATAMGGSAGNQLFLINLLACPVAFLRVETTFTSGSGTVSGNFCIKRTYAR